jgi:hypothetical protein
MPELPYEGCGISIYGAVMSITVRLETGIMQGANRPQGVGRLFFFQDTLRQLHIIRSLIFDSVKPICYSKRIHN